MLGTGFIVQLKMKEKVQVLDFKPISEKLCLLRIRGKKCNISIINMFCYWKKYGSKKYTVST